MGITTPQKVAGALFVFGKLLCIASIVLMVINTAWAGASLLLASTCIFVCIVLCVHLWWADRGEPT